MQLVFTGTIKASGEQTLRVRLMSFCPFYCPHHLRAAEAPVPLGFMYRYLLSQLFFHPPAHMYYSVNIN